MPLTVEIVTPSRILVQEQVDELNVPGELGYLGILPGHTALLITSVKASRCTAGAAAVSGDLRRLHGSA